MLGEDSSGSDEEDGSKKQEKPNEDTGITWGMCELIYHIKPPSLHLHSVK